MSILFEFQISNVIHGYQPCLEKIFLILMQTVRKDNIIGAFAFSHFLKLQFCSAHMPLTNIK